MKHTLTLFPNLNLNDSNIIEMQAQKLNILKIICKKVEKINKKAGVDLRTFQGGDLGNIP